MNEPTVWIAYYTDFSDVAIFFEEIDALRYAVGNSGMEVMQAGAGSLKEQIKTPRKFNQPNEENINGGTIAASNNGSPAPSNTPSNNGGQNPRPKEKGGAQIVDQDAALKEAQREAAARSRATDGEGASFIR